MRRTILTALSLLLGLIAVAHAGPVTRADFGSGAVNFNFGSTFDLSSVSDGELTVNLGSTSRITVAPGGVTAPLGVAPSYDNGNGGVIRLDFADPVSAVGMSFLVNYESTILSLYDSTDHLLASYTVPYEDDERCNSNGTYPCGFIGFDVGSNSIAYATIGVPSNLYALIIDDVVYQTPEPGSLALLGLGLAGLGIARRRRNKG